MFAFIYSIRETCDTKKITYVNEEEGHTKKLNEINCWTAMFSWHIDNCSGYMLRNINTEISCIGTK